MTIQKHPAPAQASAISTDALQGNPKAKTLAAKANAALEQLISPAITPKLSELPTVEARLMALADAIERQELVKHDIGFNMGMWHGKRTDGALGTLRDQTGNECGTVACVAGWTDLLENGPEGKNNNNDDVSYRAAAILGISSINAHKLFYGNGMATDEFFKVTPSRAIAVIRDFAKSGEVRWGNFDNVGNPK